MLIALLLAQAMPAAPKPACPATPVALPADYAGWDAAAPLAAAAEPGAVADAMLPIDKAVRATLQPAGALKLPAQPKKALTGTAHGGLFAFEAASAGRYRLALDSKVWADVVANGAPLPPTAFGHGPDCTSVRKTVDWTLKPGRYLLQVTGEPAAVRLEMLKVG